MFQDRSLRPEEIEGKTQPLRRKGCSAVQEGEGREIAGKRGRDILASWEHGLEQRWASPVGPGVRGMQSWQLQGLALPASGLSGCLCPEVLRVPLSFFYSAMPTFLLFLRAPRGLPRIRQGQGWLHQLSGPGQLHAYHGLHAHRDGAHRAVPADQHEP